MKKVLVVLTVMFLTGLFFSASNYGVSIAEAVDKEGVINTNCPVMGGKISKDTPYKVEHKGEQIGFCCPVCIEAFKADPDKYKGKLLKDKTAGAVLKEKKEGGKK